MSTNKGNTHLSNCLNLLKECFTLRLTSPMLLETFLIKIQCPDMYRPDMNDLIKEQINGDPN